MKTTENKKRDELESKLFETILANTPGRIKEGQLFDIANNGKFSFVVKKEHLYPYDEQKNPQGLALLSWFNNYKKEAAVSTAGVRGLQNILYPWDCRYPINILGIALVTLAKSRVARRLYPGARLHKITASEVRYNSRVYENIIARVQAANGIVTHVPYQWKKLPVWMVSFLVFVYDFLGGEYITASHSISQKIATKDINSAGSQYLVTESMEFVKEMENILKEVEQKGSFEIVFSNADDVNIDSDFMEGISNGVDPYLEYLKSAAASEKNISFVHMLSKKVVISCTHGSMYYVMPEILKGLGIYSYVGWTHKEADPFFGGIGKTEKNPITGKDEFYDYSCDATIMEMDKKTNSIQMPVIGTMRFDELLSDYRVGTIVLNTDPDGDRLVAMQIESIENTRRLKDLGIVFMPLDEKRVLSVYTPNQFFLMIMDFNRESLIQSGVFDKYPRFIIKTTPSSSSWDEWARFNNVKVVNIPVGFKHIAAILNKVESQVLEDSKKDVIVEDIFGKEINLGKTPRLLFAGEESGGMLIGPEEYIKSHNGRMAIAMREKTAGEAIVLSLAMAGFLDQREMLLSDYLEEIYRKNKVVARFDVRKDVSYYNEAQSDIVKLMQDKQKGEQFRTNNDVFYLSLAIGVKENKISMDDVRNILAEIFKGLYFGNLKSIYFVGDGTYLEFEDKFVEIRPSGTDAKTKAYCCGGDISDCVLYSEVLGKYDGSVTELFKKIVPEDIYKNAKKMSLDIYEDWNSRGYKPQNYVPATSTNYLKGEKKVRLNLLNMFGPSKISEDDYKEFRSSEIFKKALKLNDAIMCADKFGPESSREGIFGDEMLAHREKLVKWILNKKSSLKSSCMWHAGIGGQALGNRAILESLGLDSGIEIVVLEKLGYPIKDMFSKMISSGHRAKNMLIHVSSKSGTTDETMINFQSALACLIENLAEELGYRENVALDLISKYSAQEDISRVMLSDLRIDKTQVNLLKMAFERIVITTTFDLNKSRLYALAKSNLVCEILGDEQMACFPIPDNIGGRFSERSLSGDVTSAFAGIDVFTLNRGAREVLDLYTGLDCSKNPVISSAILLYLYNPDYVVIGVSDSSQSAKASALAQKFPESWGKDGKGPFVVTAVGAQSIKAFSKSKFKKLFILIQTPDIKMDSLLSSQEAFIIYEQDAVSASEEGKRLQFFDGLTKWYGLLNAAELTDDIKSSQYAKRDWQKQPFVELAKKTLTQTAGDLSREEESCKNYYSKLVESVCEKPVFSRVDLFEPNSDVFENDIKIINTLESKKCAACSSVDENTFSKIFSDLKTIFTSIRYADSKESLKFDTSIERLFHSLLGMTQFIPNLEIDDVSKKLAVIISSQIKNGRICVPIFYSWTPEAEILGQWYKFICRENNILAEYGIGTREQHSYFQSLLDGKYTVFTLLVDNIVSYEYIRKTQDPISAFGLAKEYLDGLYPDQVGRLFLEAENKAFRDVSRDSAILRLHDIASVKGAFIAFSLFARAVGMTSLMLDGR